MPRLVLNKPVGLAKLTASRTDSPICLAMLLAWVAGSVHPRDGRAGQPPGGLRLHSQGIRHGHSHCWRPRSMSRYRPRCRRHCRRYRPWCRRGHPEWRWRCRRRCWPIRIEPATRLRDSLDRRHIDDRRADLRELVDRGHGGVVDPAVGDDAVQRQRAGGDAGGRREAEQVVGLGLDRDFPTTTPRHRRRCRRRVVFLWKMRLSEPPTDRPEVACRSAESRSCPRR